MVVASKANLRRIIMRWKNTSVRSHVQQVRTLVPAFFSVSVNSACPTAHVLTVPMRALAHSALSAPSSVTALSAPSQLQLAVIRTRFCESSVEWEAEWRLSE